jgi:heme/copper-type cytochrome/quinol oxidase subunit 3
MGPASGKASTHAMRTDDVPEGRSLAYAGMVIFLGSWTMLFGALFFSYAVLRVSAPIWPPPRFERLPLVLPGIATLLLLASSGTLALALARLRSGQLARCRNELLCTIALGVAFGALQCKVWVHLWKGGLHLGSGAHGGTFYVLTGFHFIHVLVGLGLLGRLIAPLVRRVPVAPARVPAALTAMFWHFAGAVWLTTFVAVYLI